MTVSEAKTILDKNAFCQEESFRESLCEDSYFSEEYFWELYDCIIALADDARETGLTVETTAKILGVCNRIFQLFVFHFDPNDLAEIRNFPENYPCYIERLNDAVDAYLRGVFVDEELYELQRPRDIQ